MKAVSSRYTETFLSGLHKFPASEEVLRAKMQDGMVVMQAKTPKGKWRSIEKVEKVKIEWGHASRSGHEVGIHQVHMCNVSRVILDDDGKIEAIVDNMEAFVSVELAFGSEILLPLYDERLYTRVVKVKFKER